ncbi:ERF family protein [Campylobacter majalis]|uniref:ERF family protein n=1 Tax=Campylobacter majalis TaxID=2790656 RepID=UPI003D6899C1
MIKILSQIQTELKAPKGLYNSFGKYHYRSCENILEALKPLLQKHNVALTISDEIALIGDRYYIKATAVLKGQNGEVSATAYAREADAKKGMDESQITGSTSSYARKYALNGLFAIDDEKDADSTNDHANNAQTKSPPKQATLNNDEVNDLCELIKLTHTDTAEFLSYFKVKQIADVPYEKAKTMLLTKLNKIQGAKQ